MSFEKEVGKQIERGEEIANRVNISVLKYFWQVSPLSGGGSQVIPKFLRDRRIFKNFSDNELRILAGYLHHRSFALNEAIFNQGDSGVGFYFIFSGQVDMFAKDPELSKENDLKKLEDLSLEGGGSASYVTSLEEGDLFGELAFLQENAVRTATAIAKANCELLGIFKPDMEELINEHPRVGAKLLQSVAIVLAARLSSIASDMKILKHKLLHLKSSGKDGSNNG